MTNMANPYHFAQAPPQYHLPRILCLHGGGANAEVFRLQCRALTTMLADTYRFVFIEGPAFCAPHEALIAVYGDYAPFRRWTSWLPEHRTRGIGPEAEWDECLYAVQSGMDADTAEAATALGESGSAARVGKWVGLMGFSQGARIAASLLYQRQAERETGEKSMADWQWAVLMAGRGPIITREGLRVPDGLGEVEEVDEGEQPRVHKLKMPTLHIHGMLDPGLLYHQLLLEKYCEPGTTALVEWEGDHRIPIKTPDVKRVVDAMLKMSEKR